MNQEKETQLKKLFGDSIRKIRLGKNLSQEKLAFESGLDRSYLGGVERGERNISLVNIVCLLRSLDVTPADLFNFINEIDDN